MLVSFEISVGDFIDRYTIAEIKTERIGSEALKKDLDSRYMPMYRNLLETSFSNSVVETYNALRDVNTKLWDIEDDIRNAVNNDDISDLSKAIISLNDARAFHKRKLDQVFGFVGDPKKYTGVIRNYSI